MKNTKLLLTPLFFITLFAASEKIKAQQSVLLQYESRIDSIIDQMTLEEKVNMMHGKHTFVSSGTERLGIADIKYADGPFGIREELQPDGWGPLGWENDKSTFFPTGSALAATWSPEMAYKYGKAMAKEARLRGKDMILGPAINIQRIPTGGRTYEYLSEDPFLSGRLSVAYTEGVQDNGVAVCLKHYAMNNQENNRGNVNVIIGERAMREIYLPPFEDAVREADAFGVMAAYNKVNGKWCSENDILLNKILRNDWGFAGMVISDWYGTHSTVDAVENGLNVEMPGDKFLGRALLDSVKAGNIPEEIINQRIREILRVRLAIKPVPEDQANNEMTSQPEQQKIAYEVASKSIVMLKNDGILPLNLSKKQKIAVIGDNANRKMALGGVGAGVKALYEITPLEGLKSRIGDKAVLEYAQGYQPGGANYGRRFNRSSEAEIEKARKAYEIKSKQLMNEAIDLASNADIVIFIGGNNRLVETEASDRTNIFLPYGQDSLIQKIAAVNPNIITILVSGAPNDLNVVNKVSKAVLISWFNGSEGGNALADVITGAISPGGRLPFTLPVKLEDSPAYTKGNYPQGRKNGDIFVGGVEGTEENKTENHLDNDPNTAYYSEESLVGYRWFDTKEQAVMYPFGHGMSYSTFNYSDIKTSKNTYGKLDIINISIHLENTGTFDAEEVVQAYVHRINSSIDWPEKELKAFKRVVLNAGQKSVITLEIPVKDLFYWNIALQDWDYDPCDIELLVGASAGDVKLKRKVLLK